MKRFINKTIILLLLLGLLNFPLHGYAQAETLVRVDPQMTVVDKGEAFTLDIRVENVQDLSAFDVALHFNPDHLMVTSLTLGDFLSPGLGGNSYDNETGFIHFYNAIFSSSEPGSGSGILFTVHFTAKTVDVDTIVSIDEALTEFVEAETNDLIPYTSQNGHVQIGEGSEEYKIFLPLVLG